MGSVQGFALLLSRTHRALLDRGPKKATCGGGLFLVNEPTFGLVVAQAAGAVQKRPEQRSPG